jgi:hypothetical protein
MCARQRLRLVSFAIGTLAISAPVHAQTGRPHSCSRWQQSNSGVEGVAKIAFLITTEGSVVGPRLTATSGDSKQDAASLQCVQTWLYRPTIKDGAPVETPWTVEIAWNPSLPPALADRIGQCAQSLAATFGNVAGIENAPEFAIDYRDFKVAAVGITKSSGSANLDKAATECLKQPNENQVETVVVKAGLDLNQQSTFHVKMPWTR